MAISTSAAVVILARLLAVLLGLRPGPRNHQIRHGFTSIEARENKRTTLGSVDKEFKIEDRRLS
jgi:hypothetical protein